MADNEAFSVGSDIDLDRVIIDPDYRRIVIAMLRQTEARSEAAAVPRAPEAQPAPPGNG